jgi:hypothetical protein
MLATSASGQQRQVRNWKFLVEVINQFTVTPPIRLAVGSVYAPQTQAVDNTPFYLRAVLLGQEQDG